MNLERQEYIIEPAKNLPQLRNNLQIVDGLNEENMAYHVNLHEEIMAILQDRLMTTQNPKETFFLAGQRGSGKTTLVDYIFAQDIIKDTFETIKLSIHELTNIDDEHFDVVEILVLLTTEILKRSPDSVKKKYKEEVAKIKQNKITEFKDSVQIKPKRDKLFHAMGLRYRGLAHGVMGNFEQALKYHQQEGKLMKELDNENGLINSYTSQGNVLKDLGRLNEALIIFKKQEKLSNKLGDNDNIASTYNNQGLIFNFK